MADLSTEHAALRRWRQTSINQIMLPTLICMLPVMALDLVRHWSNGQWLLLGQVVAVSFFMAVITLNQRMSASWRAILLIVGALVYGTVLLVQTGFVGSGRFYLVVAAILAALFLRLPLATISWALILATFTAILAAIGFGAIPVPANLATIIRDPLFIAGNGLALVGLSVGVLIALRSLSGQLNASLNALEAAQYQLEDRVSQRTAALHQALAENRYLLTAITTAPVGMVMIQREAANWVISYVSPAFTTITGYAQKKALGQPYHLIFGPNTEPSLRVSVEHALDHATPLHLVLQTQRADAQVYWCELNLSPVQDEQQQVVGFVVLLSEVSERIEIQLALARQLRYSQTLAHCSRLLMLGRAETDQWRDALTEAFTKLRIAIGASRLYLYENFEHPHFGFASRLVAENRDPNFPGFNHAQALPWADTPSEVMATLARGEAWYGTTDEYYRSFNTSRRILEQNYVKALILIPIRSDGRWWGYLGASDCQTAREWDEETRRLLLVIGEMVTAFITERNHVRKLAYRDALLRSVGRMAQIGGWEYDPLNRSLLWSEEIFAIRGIPFSDTPTIEMAFQFFPPDHRATLRAAFETCLQHGMPWDLELPMLTQRGQRIWVRSQGEPVYENGQIIRLRGTLQDITSRKQSELELRSSEERYRRLADLQPDTMLLLFDRDCRHSLAAGPALAALQLTPPMIEGRTVEDFPERWQLGFLRDLYREALHGQVQQLSHTFNQHIFDVQILPMPAADGTIVGGMLVARDVTAERLAKEELVRARDAAEAADRAKSDFLAHMSHEIRTPLNAVIGVTDLLLETDLDFEQRSYAGAIRNGGETLLETLNSILDLSRIESRRIDLEIQPFDLHESLAHTIDLIAFDAERKGLLIRLEIADLAPRHVVGDQGRIRQILVNLLANAIKFTAEGEVCLYVEADPPLNGQATLRFHVADTGIGISPDHRERIFEPFTQAESSTTRNYGGTGLGLTISRQLAELMQGVLTLESEVGRGSTFTLSLSLPVVARQALPIPPSAMVLSPQPAALPSHLPTLRILLAEDNMLNQQVARRLLERIGCSAEVVDNGQDALDQVKQGDYDVVLMDVQMPRLDGEAATREIRALGPQIRQPRIIALTAHALSGSRERFLQAGMDDYLSKPIRIESLRAALLNVPPGAATEELPAAPPAAAPTALTAVIEEPINWQILERVAATLGPNAEQTIGAIVNIFREETPPQLDLLSAAMSQDDRQQIRRVAHRICGSARQIGADQLARQLAALEVAAPQADFSSLRQQLVQILLTYQATLRQLDARYSVIPNDK